MTTTTTMLTCGDLEDLDAGQLREHLTEFLCQPKVTARGFAYADGVAGRIARLAGLDRLDVLAECCADAEAAGVR